jgi:hypothetical protein
VWEGESVWVSPVPRPVTLLSFCSRIESRDMRDVLVVLNTLYAVKLEP